MTDLPNGHYKPEGSENLDDCPYIKRFYRWAKKGPKDEPPSLEMV